VLRAARLPDASLDIPIYIPQGVNASVGHRLDDRWTLLGSVGWHAVVEVRPGRTGHQSTTDPRR